MDTSPLLDNIQTEAPFFRVRLPLGKSIQEKTSSFFGHCARGGLGPIQIQNVKWGLRKSKPFEKNFLLEFGHYEHFLKHWL